MDGEEQSESVRRVTAAAATLGLDVAVRRMPASTRTAAEAAQACDCEIGQIVKSLVFEGAVSGGLTLFLVSGAHALNEVAAEEAIGEPLRRADPKRVRAETGFAIGGVSPIGHLAPIRTVFDAHLSRYDVVWAAAGAPNAVFSVAPAALATATKAESRPLGPVGAP